ncbi:MAG: PLDc N-terminal domain-containing protein [Protaetiibacter sp.]
MAALLRYLPIIIALVLLVAAVVDIVRIDPSRVRALPKGLWVVIAIAIVVIGPILWFALGREPLESRNHGRYRSAPSAPDDDPEFLRRLAREKEQEQRIRDLEKRLSELGDDDAPKSPPQ